MIKYLIKKKLGKTSYKIGDFYQGGYKDDLKSGLGVYQFHEGRRYEGEFKDNLFHGKGISYIFYSLRI